MKISIVIPNFNGKDLLSENLPNVLQSGADEVLVNDDASSDESINFIKKNFPEIKLLINQKNQGFIPSVNKLFKEAGGDIVVLINNDVWVQKDFLNNLLLHFKDKKIFAVNCHEEGEGWADAFWKNGFFEFKRGEESKLVHKSAWASGGSAAFRKDLWIKLDGFDKVYEPFYFEDVDISFRALKAGYEILWEPSSNIKHQHGTTINKFFSQKYLTWIEQRNQLLFIWKNINDPKLRRDHKTNLLKRLFKGSGLGYWIPYLSALIRSRKIKKNDLPLQRSDWEVINYASS